MMICRFVMIALVAVPSYKSAVRALNEEQGAIVQEPTKRWVTN